LVRVAEQCLQPHDGLALGGEAEMTGLDDAGVDRADRNLVQIVAVGGQEGGRFRRAADARLRPDGQRVRDRPASVIEPRAVIHGAVGRMAPQVMDGAFEPRGGGAVRRQGGVASVLDLRAEQARRVGLRRIQRVHDLRVGPQADEALRVVARGREPRGHGVACAIDVNQAKIAPGIARPSTSTSARCSHTGTSAACGGTGPGSAVAGPRQSVCRRAICTQAAITSPASSAAASQGDARTAASATRNSLENRPNGGRPASAITQAASDRPSARWFVIRPVISAKCWPPFICAARPTHWNVADLVSVCTVTCSRPAKVAAGPPMPNANAATPACSTEEYEKNRFTSRRGHRLNAASSTDSSPSATSGSAGLIAAWFAFITPRSRRITNNATFSTEPERIADIGVGPSACASGIQACSGASAALVP